MPGQLSGVKRGEEIRQELCKEVFCRKTQIPLNPGSSIGCHAPVLRIMKV